MLVKVFRIWNSFNLSPLHCLAFCMVLVFPTASASFIWYEKTNVLNDYDEGSRTVLQPVYN